MTTPADKKHTTNKNYSKTDLEFMNSLSNAMLSGSSSGLNTLLYLICLIIAAAIAWAYFAELDERTKGTGRTIPSKQIQVIQNLEGGIIKQIHVYEGQEVKKGQVLVTIDDTGIGSSFAESANKIKELKAQISRLRAEAGLTEKVIPEEGVDENDVVMQNEIRLYRAKLTQYENKRSALEQQLRQKQIDLQSASQDLKSYKSSLRMIEREVDLSRPLREKQLLSELEFLRLEQRQLEKKQEIDNTVKKIEKLQVQQLEAEQNIAEHEKSRQTEALAELNQALAELDRVSLMQVAIKDRVTRTNVRSPVNGIVKQLLINTVGGVVAPGMDILEIVPNDDSLVIETKITPADIAFIYPGQKAILKFTAYDFAIYGGLEGEVTQISADTITDEKGGEFYLVKIKTEKNFLGSENDPKKIIVGMTAQVDIITGKKTVMQYLLKPILRAKENALRER